MGKRIILIFLAALAVRTLHAEYLWYTVSSDDTGFPNITKYLDELNISQFYKVYAQVVAERNGEKTVLGSQGFTPNMAINGMASVSLSALGGDAIAYSYYIEICSTMVTGPIGYSAHVPYASLNGHITDSLSDMPAASAWHGSGYMAQPEPTGGVMVLLGLAVLVLKRKKERGDVR